MKGVMKLPTRGGGIRTAPCAGTRILVPQPRFCDLLVELTLHQWNKKIRCKNSTSALRSSPLKWRTTFFWTNCEDFFGQNHKKMLENSRFWELDDPGGIVFVRRKRLDNYVVTKFFCRCENTIAAPENSDFDQL